MPVLYYLHKEGQFLNSNGRMAHKLNQNYKDQIEVAAWDMEMLNNPSNDCAPDTWSFDDCLYETLEREMRGNTGTGCTVPWTKNNSKICTTKDDIETAFDISWNRGTNQVHMFLIGTCTLMTSLFWRGGEGGSAKK